MGLNNPACIRCRVKPSATAAVDHPNSSVRGVMKIPKPKNTIPINSDPLRARAATMYQP